MRYERVYLDITARFLKEGGIRPLEIIWTDGKRYIIDKIKFIERTPSKAGGTLPYRYTVIIGGLERYLYYEDHAERWFVEKKLL